MNCVIADTCTPRWVAPAITGLASASTSAAGQERHQRREQCAERDEQQHDDEQERELLDIALRALRLTLLIDEPGDRAR